MNQKAKEKVLEAEKVLKESKQVAEQENFHSLKKSLSLESSSKSEIKSNSSASLPNQALKLKNSKLKKKINEKINSQTSQFYDGFDPDTPKEAVERFVKAKLIVLEEEVEQVHKENTELKKKTKTLEDSLKTKEEELKTANKIINQKNIALNKLSKENLDLKNLNEKILEEIETLRKVRGFKQLETSHNSKDLKLLEEHEILKNNYTKSQNDLRDLQLAYKQTEHQLIGEVKRMEKQKLDLLQAFKKQMRLIEILRKQKVIISLDPSANDDFAIRSASENGHADVVKLLLE
ncbi:hypothetical protein ROZALSC1DRAFT_31170, partial [Rozella allomycis CSF55]